MMMGGGPGHGRYEEARKAKNASATLSRLMGYFAPYRMILFGVLALILVGTLVQVASPFLIGQAVDCFIAPTPASHCALSQHPAPSLSGLMRVVLAMALLALLGAASTGAQFYLMAQAGQRVVQELRNKSFEQIHRLSVSYYTEHEFGDVMSRLTNDVDTITQAVNFGLVQVVSGSLALVGIIIAMLALNVSLALLCLIVVPFMVAVTLFCRIERGAHTGRRASKWARSTLICRKASAACARRRRSTVKRKTSTSSAAPTTLIVRRISAP